MIKRLNNLALVGFVTLMTSPVFANDKGLQKKAGEWKGMFDLIIDLFLYIMFGVGIIMVGIGVMQLIQSGKNQQITIKDWGLKILGGAILSSLTGFVVFAQDSVDLDGGESLNSKAGKIGFKRGG